MIRWYDYALAIVAADFLLGNIVIAFNADVWWLNLLGGAAAYFIWDIWNNTYCEFRLRRESQRRR